MAYKGFGNYILVKEEKEERTTDSGLYFPVGDTYKTGVVVSVQEGIAEGSRILFGNAAGIVDELLVIHVDNIWGVIE